MKTTPVLAILFAAALAGCSAGDRLDGRRDRLPPPDVDTGTPAPSPCGAAQMGYLVGQQVAEVDLRTLSREVRLIRPDTAITEDYRPGRLNLDLDAAGVILRPWCG